MPTELEELLRKTDTLTEKAQGAVLSVTRDIRKEILYLANELDLAGSADNREAVYAKVSSMIGGLRTRLDDIFTYADDNAVKLGSKYAQEDGDLKTKIDRKGAKAIVDAVRAAGERNLAATMTNAMQGNIIDALRNATVSALREQALTGGTNRQLQELILQKWTAVAKDPKNLMFIDRSGRTWDTQTYLNMNARTNATRIFNDSVVSTVAKNGKDLVMVSRGGDPDCRKCFAWEGRILSITGKTKEFPTYEAAMAAGLFHPNCTHTLETVDEEFDADEIELQRQFTPPSNMSDDTAMDDQRYEIDIARKMMQDGLDPTAARIAVDRDNLANAIRQGLITDDAEKIVAGLSDEQVTALCPNGNPPEFAPAKDADGNEGWNHGKNGGVFYIGDREHPITVERLVTVSDIGAGVPVGEYKPSVKVKAKNGKQNERQELTNEQMFAAIEERYNAYFEMQENTTNQFDELEERINNTDIAEYSRQLTAYAVTKRRDEAWVKANVQAYDAIWRQVAVVDGILESVQRLKTEAAEQMDKCATIWDDDFALKDLRNKKSALRMANALDSFEKKAKKTTAELVKIEGEFKPDQIKAKCAALVSEGKAVIDALTKDEAGDTFTRKTLKDIGITDEDQLEAIRNGTDIGTAIRKTSGLNDGFEKAVRISEAERAAAVVDFRRKSDQIRAEGEKRIARFKGAFDEVYPYRDGYSTEKAVKAGEKFIAEQRLEKEFERFKKGKKVGYFFETKRWDGSPLDAEQIEIRRAKGLYLFIDKQIENERRRMHRQIADAFGEMKSRQFESSPIFKLTPKNKGKINSAAVKERSEKWGKTEKMLERIFDAEVIPKEQVNVVRNESGDGRASQSGEFMNMDAHDDEATYAHEYSHFVEGHNKHVHDRCREFLLYRAEKSGQTTTQRLRDITRIRYRNDEITLKDDFFDPYCGKVYASGFSDTGLTPFKITTDTGNAAYSVRATEILSMGVEKLLRDADEFYKQDREYFDFVVNLIQGRL